MKIVSLSPVWNRELAALLDQGLEFTTVDPKDRSAIQAALADADIVVSARFTAQMSRWAPRLRLLVCPAAGTDGIERDSLAASVRVVQGSGHEQPMAEYTIGALVALRQHFLEADAALRRGEWKYGFFADRVNGELAGSTLGLLGFGGIGQAVARAAGCLGMRCAAVTRSPAKVRAGAPPLEFLGSLADAADVDRLLTWCDALVVCCELSDLTRGLLDQRRFELMKPDAVVINIARGGVVAEEDFYQALARGRIAGAAIDVWYRYPPEERMPAGHPFWELPNVLMTPHASAWTDATKARRVAAMAEAINRFARAPGRA
jgi:phosphoglycerate dehydrogenase-like enzyme